MKIGFFTACFENGVSLEELVKWASEQNFDAIEVACWPKNTHRRYGGKCHIDVEIIPQAAEKIKDLLQVYNLEISALGYYSNNLHPDLAKREANLSHLKKTIEAASMLGIKLVGTFVGRDPSKSIEDNLKMFTEVFFDIINYAKENNVKIMIENCPMTFSGLPGENIAYSPEVWEKMFELIPSENIGLNFDPSHLIWQGIDYIKALKYFKEKIFHTHAKDTTIEKQILNKIGIYGDISKWRTDKLPGLGDINWRKYIATLYEIGYEGIICIEHEDRTWEANKEKKKEGLLLSKQYLSQFIIRKIK